MLIDKLKAILEKYYTTVGSSAEDPFSKQVKDIDIYENPTAKELKEIMADEKDSTRSFRFIIDDSGKSYVWKWDKAIHMSIKNKLGLGNNCVAGTVVIIPYRGVEFDLGKESINTDNNYSRGEIEEIFFDSELAKALNITLDSYKVSFYEYNYKS
jgi:hypothetical protein